MNGWLPRLAGAVLAVASMAPIAVGQGFGAFGGQGGPSVTQRDLEDYATMLEMDESQRELTTALFENYRDQIQADAQEFRGVMEEARAEFEETRDRSAFDGVRERGEALRDRRETLETTFFSDIKSLLTPEQTSHWPKVERTHRRRATLDRGLMSGERVDLIEIAREVEVAGEAQVAEALQLYEQDLDRALVHRNAVIEDAFGQVRELFQAGEQDRIERLFENARDASRQVRDTNRRYTEQIAAALPPERAEVFRSAVREAALPRVYRPTHAQRSLEAAAGFADLTEDQRAAVAGMRERYRNDVLTINTQLERAIEQAEEDADARRFIRMRFQRGGDRGRGRGGEGGDDGTRDLMGKRRDLDRQTLALLSEALTEEQIERLPRREADRDDQEGDRRGGRRGGGNRDLN